MFFLAIVAGVVAVIIWLVESGTFNKIGQSMVDAGEQS
jgi:hypothetical protein